VRLLSSTGLLPSLVRLSRPVLLEDAFVTPRKRCVSCKYRPTTPDAQRTHPWHTSGLGCSPFARRYLGNRGCFLFLGVLRCFSSPGCPRTPMYSVYDSRILLRPGCPIRESPDRSLLAAPRGLSQLAAPFVGPWRQGIHRMLLVA